jgi:uncharacterized protein YndB with AHSA1/START domain
VSGVIRLHRSYQATRAELWDLIATQEGLASWLMPNDFRPEIGHRFTFTDRPRPPFFDGIVGCAVLDLEPLHRLRISWSGGPVDTVVTFTIVDAEPGWVRLDLEHSGFTGLRAGIVRAILDLGWRDLLRRALSRRLANHPDQ